MSILQCAYTEIISFIRSITYNFCIFLQGRVILKELILSIPLSGRAIFPSKLPKGYISQYTPKGKYWMFCVLGNTLVQEGDTQIVKL